MKRTCTPKQVQQIQYETLDWTGTWAEAFGRPEVNETWFVMGPSAGGKSSFVMQLAKQLCKTGKVLYLSYEEGVSQSVQERLQRFRMDEVNARFTIAQEWTVSDLRESLKKQRSARFVIVDSFQMSTWTYEDVAQLRADFPKKCFIYVSQEWKGQPLGKPATRLRYLAGVKIRVAGFRAYCQGRFSGDPGCFYTVWEEGVIRATNNLPTEVDKQQISNS